MRMTILKRDLEIAYDEGTKEIEITGAALLTDAGPLEGSLRPGGTVTIQVDLQANEPVEDPVVSFALHDGTNRFVCGGDTAAAGAALGRVDAKRRVRFLLGPVPFVQGKYWVTLGVHSRDRERTFHVQDQRYAFEVQQPEGGRDQVHLPVAVEVDEL
jgi:hypothetical protein